MLGYTPARGKPVEVRILCPLPARQSRALKWENFHKFVAARTLLRVIDRDFALLNAGSWTHTALLGRWGARARLVRQGELVKSLLESIENKVRPGRPQ